MYHWIEQELATLELHDQRRNQRVKRMVRAMAQRPSGSITGTFTTRAESEAAYRLLHSEEISTEALRQAVSDACLGRVQEEPLVLAVQDTTFFNFTAHPATSGMGALGHQQLAGFLKHSVLAVSAAGVPLGLLHEQCWARDFAAIGQKHQRKERAFEDKESFRWLASQRVIQSRVPPSTTVITIADREGDLFELFAEARPTHAHLLIRACYDRCVEGPAPYLWPAVEAAPVAGQFTITLRRRPPRRPREAHLSLRFAPVRLQPPRHGVHDRSRPPVRLTAILVEESAPPAGEEPVGWLLLTTLPLADYPAARQCVQYYSQRWLVERYHYVLKSGCQIEDSQLRTRAALERLVCLYSIVAWRLLWMTYRARRQPQEPCTVAFSELEWQTLWRLQHGAVALPEAPPSLRPALHWTASLAGFWGRKGDGQPGVKRLWRGLMRPQDIVLGVALTRPAQDVRNA